MLHLINSTPLHTFAAISSDSIAIATTLLALSAYIMTSYLLARIFTKASIPSWRAWVPIYNSWTLYELGKQRGEWALVSVFALTALPFLLIQQTFAVGVILLLLGYIASFVAGIVMYVAMFYIGRGFGKSDSFILWGIFLPLVWYIWLALDDSKWRADRLTR